MLDMMTPAPGATRASTDPVVSYGSLPAGPAIGALLARALDEVDYGVVLVADDGDVLHLNHRARQLLQGDQALQLLGNRLRTRDARDLGCLHGALRDATRRGLRRLLAVGEDDTRQLVSLVPVEPGIAALMIGRTRVCEDLSIQCFARTHALTAAETRVLAALGRGVKPTEIANAQGVKLSTVRTQIGAIRGKTGAASITALVRMVAALPPMVSALRG